MSDDTRTSSSYDDKIQDLMIDLNGGCNLIQQRISVVLESLDKKEELIRERFYQHDRDVKKILFATHLLNIIELVLIAILCLIR